MGCEQAISPKSKGSQLTGGLYIYQGNIHVHSTYSDGSGTFAQIAEAAASAGLHYVIVTDHDTLAGLAEESIIKGVVVLVGVEINKHKNHYLALGLRETVPPNEEDPQRVIDRVSSAQGIGFIAHPFEKATPYIEQGKAYPWVHWPVFGFQGLEIWNYTSHWRSLNQPLLKVLYWYFFNRRGAVCDPPPECLHLWDLYNRAGYHTTGIGSSDAHASRVKIGPFTAQVFSYHYLFKTINTYIILETELSEELDLAREQILGALCRGRCYLVFDSLGSGRGFFFQAFCSGRKERYLMGDTLLYKPGISLRITAPGRRHLIHLVGNGCLLAESTRDVLTYQPSRPGVYRAEVYHRPLLGRPRPWIYSNPIIIT